MNDETLPENKTSTETPEEAIGTYATAAAKAALTALITGNFPDPVGIILPDGEVPYFQLAYEGLGEGYAMAGIIRHEDHMQDEPGDSEGTTIISTVFPAPPGSGIIFQAGEGVDETALDPLSRRLTMEICEHICAEYDLPADLVVTISIPQSEAPH
ncbi:cobalt-precorrin-5B (C(1))-methyltransferase [Falsochrobactrum sp. TDYN1]|uniref:Cobalt-precorrin-5B (C(1))-methyltransferase n=1 Tax=Falsochrobactrum tianjinense TaxID=2706015 RepID=A0A949PP16_9HYPH|nr:cobalt-precorrin-5B (C(1))-methyltransferase [Falsochrobactrum sp. TDYN1]